MRKDLDYYRAAFTSLHTNKARGLSAPHKPLLLLTVLIDPELFELLQDETVRAHLRTLLISTYLAPHAQRLPILEAIAFLGSLSSVIA